MTEITINRDTLVREVEAHLAEHHRPYVPFCDVHNELLAHRSSERWRRLEAVQCGIGAAALRLIARRLYTIKLLPDMPAGPPLFFVGYWKTAGFLVGFRCLVPSDPKISSRPGLSFLDVGELVDCVASDAMMTHIKGYAETISRSVRLS